MKKTSKVDLASIQRLSALRWESSIDCPFCESTDVSDLMVNRGLYQCRNCRKQFGVFKGTRWEGTRMSPSQWEEYVRTIFRMMKTVVYGTTYVKWTQPDILIDSIPIRSFMSSAEITSYSTARSFLDRIKAEANLLLKFKNNKIVIAQLNKPSSEDSFIKGLLKP